MRILVEFILVIALLSSTVATMTSPAASASEPEGIFDPRRSYRCSEIGTGREICPSIQDWPANQRLDRLRALFQTLEITQDGKVIVNSTAVEGTFCLGIALARGLKMKAEEVAAWERANPLERETSAEWAAGKERYRELLIATARRTLRAKGIESPTDLELAGEILLIDAVILFPM